MGSGGDLKWQRKHTSNIGVCIRAIIPFSAPYEPFDGALEMLESYKRAGVPLGLCTKGDEEVQWSKIERHGLDEIFDSIVICPRKYPEDILQAADRLTEEYGVTDFYMIGDSRRDDILGGNTLGFKTILVQPEESVDWHYESGFEHVQPTHTVRQVTEMLQIVPVSMTTDLKRSTLTR